MIYNFVLYNSIFYSKLHYSQIEQNYVKISQMVNYRFITQEKNIVTFRIGQSQTLFGISIYAIIIFAFVVVIVVVIAVIDGDVICQCTQTFLRLEHLPIHSLTDHNALDTRQTTA